MAALYDVDGIDLHITQMGNGSPGRGRTVAKGRHRVEALRRDPDMAGSNLAEGKWGFGHGRFRILNRTRRTKPPRSVN